MLLRALIEPSAGNPWNKATQFHREVPKHFDFQYVVERTIAQKMKQRLGPKFEYGPPLQKNGAYSQHVAPECRLKDPVAIYKDPSLDKRKVRKALDEAVEEIHNTNKPRQETLPKNATVVTIDLSHASDPELEIKTIIIRHIEELMRRGKTMTELLIIRDPKHDFEIHLAPPAEREKPKSHFDSCLLWIDQKLKALEGVREIKLEVPHYTLSVMKGGNYQRGCYIAARDLDELCEPTTGTVKSQ